MTYRLKIEIQGLPRTINASNRSHWAVKLKEVNYWKRMVWEATLGKRPVAPLKRAKVKYTRYSSVPSDYDGLVSSFKHVQDALIDAKIIENDSLAIIGCPEYWWMKGKQRMGYITVEVEEIPVSPLPGQAPA